MYSSTRLPFQMNRFFAAWMAILALLTVSILYLADQQTAMAMHSANLDQFTSAVLRQDTIRMSETEKIPPQPQAAHGDTTSTNKNNYDSNDATGSIESDNPETQKKKRHKNKRQRHDQFLVDRPPLTDLVSDYDRGITGNVSPLLDFAILGHAKCATSFIMNWLSVHPQVQIFKHEVCDLNEGRPAELVRQLYQELPVGEYKRGFKCPGHFSRRSLRDIRRYFPRAALIVGLRHPVRWFESFYNFRYRHPRLEKDTLPEPAGLMGSCTAAAQGVCTARAEFHGNLAMFGKTNMTNGAEWKLLRMREKYQRISPVDNPVFLYEVNQLYDTNETRTADMKIDLRDFLGLQQDMPEPVKEGKSSKPKYNRIDVCDSKFDEIRLELLDVGDRAATWITRYFMESDQVVVSSREYFKELLEDWKVDPCVKARATENM